MNLFGVDGLTKNTTPFLFLSVYFFLKELSTVFFYKSFSQAINSRLRVG